MSRTSKGLPRAGSRGFTLLESLFVLMLLSIVMGVIFYAYIISTRILVNDFSEADASFQAQKAMENMVHDLRNSPLVIVSSRESVSFWYQDLNNNGTMESSEIITYTWTGGTIDAITKKIGSSSVIIANNILSFSITYETPSSIKLVKITLTAGKNNVLSTLESSVNLRNM